MVFLPIFHIAAICLRETTIGCGEELTEVHITFRPRCILHAKSESRLDTLVELTYFSNGENATRQAL